MTNVYPAPVTEESRSFARILWLTNLMIGHAEAGHGLRASFYRGWRNATIKAHEKAFGPIVKR